MVMRYQMAVRKIKHEGYSILCVNAVPLMFCVCRIRTCIIAVSKMKPRQRIRQNKGPVDKIPRSLVPMV